MTAPTTAVKKSVITAVCLSLGREECAVLSLSFRAD